MEKAPRTGVLDNIAGKIRAGTVRSTEGRKDKRSKSQNHVGKKMANALDGVSREDMGKNVGRMLEQMERKERKESMAEPTRQELARRQKKGIT